MKILIQLTILALFSGCTTSLDQVLYSSSQNGNSDIFLMNSEGVILKQISDSSYEEWGPVWINDNEISFLRQIEDDIVIIKKNLRLNLETEIPHPDNCIIDDKNIIYTKNGSSGLFTCNGNIFYKSLNQDFEMKLAIDINGFSNYLEWVDEKSFLFTNNQEGNNEIYSYDLEKKALSRLTNNEANDERGAISPNGKYLLFSSNRIDEGNQEILLMNLETREITNVSNSGGNELIARWSKSGKTIYYGSNKDGNWEIYSYDLMNSKSKRLTNNEAFDGDPRIN